MNEMSQYQILTHRRAGGDTNPPGEMVGADGLLPHIQQRVGVQGEGANVVEQHDPDGEGFPPTARKHRVDIGCKAQTAQLNEVLLT